VDHGRRQPASTLRVPRVACFNPCCSGSRSSTSHRHFVSRLLNEVSILVVVDHGRRPERKHDSVSSKQVSILVVVDHGRRLPSRRRKERSARSFNPCCSGSRSSTHELPSASVVLPCFNPCCSGSRSSTVPISGYNGTWTMFQSLL